MTLKQAGVTDDRARAAAVVVRDDVKITQLEVSIDERLARLEKDLRWLKWGVMAVFLLLSGGGVMTAFLLLGGEFFKAVFGADTQTLSATLRARPVTVARAHISGAAKCRPGEDGIVTIDVGWSFPADEQALLPSLAYSYEIIQ
jgi:hypothetical protein